VCDSDGNWHRTDTRDITFTCAGPVNYRGGFNHDRARSTGKPTLHAQLGKIVCAVRSTNEPGTITVIATANGLESGSVQIQSIAPKVSFDEDVAAVYAPAVFAHAPFIGVRQTIGGAVVVRFTVPSPGKVSVEMLDTRGRVVEHVTQLFPAAGYGEVTIRRGKMPAAAGVYVFRVNVNGWKSGTKMIRVR
jgi:hypothetical protein